MREVRLQKDLQELIHFAGQTGGRLVVTGHSRQSVSLRLTCYSAVKSEGAVAIAERDHFIELALPPAWPAEAPIVLVRDPEIYHPNCAPRQGLAHGLFGLLLGGFVCYAARYSPLHSLSMVVNSVYDLIAMRNGKWSKRLTDCLNPEAVRWANEMAASGLFPLDRRPLVQR